MVKQEFIERSPVRVFEKSLDGGLKAGEIGVITSRKGLGKTSVLVQLGLDMLLQDKVVIHVSFNQQSDYVITWYNDIFDELSKKKNLAEAADVKEELMRKRINLNFNQDYVKAENLINTLKALAAGGFAPACVIVDGLDMSAVTKADLDALKAYGKEAGICMWFSYNAESEDIKTVFGDIADSIENVVALAQDGKALVLKVLKAHSAASTTTLKLDSKTLLISEK